jgi:hypothetical protein
MSFESTFFGPGNSLQWEKILDRKLPASTLEKLDPFIESMSQEIDASVLPRLFPDGSVVWYILSPSNRTIRFSREEFRGFLGLSYSLSDGVHTRLDPADGIDSAVLERYGNSAFKIFVPSELREVARDRLLTYLKLRTLRPTRLKAFARTVSRILRDFEYSILAGSYEEASEHIDELRAAGHLSAMNLLFLHVRALACAHRWSEICDLPEMDALLNIRRPIRVTECLTRAVYITQLQPFENEFKPEEARARFGQLYDQYQDLYKTRSKLRGDEIDVSFMLAALVADPVRSDLAKAILQTVNRDTDHGKYLAALGELFPRPTTSVADPLTEARQAFANGDIDKAIEQAVRSPASVERAILLLRCAREAGTLDAAGTALDSLKTLPESDLALLRSSVPTAKLIAGLESLSSDAGPAESAKTEVLSGWLPWLQRIHQANLWDRALAVAEAGAREWDPEELGKNPRVIGQLTDALLEDTPEWSRTIFRDSVPYLVDFFTMNGSDSRFRTIYESLFLLVAMDEQMSAAQAQVLARLADVRMSLGVSQSMYLDLIAQLKNTLQSMNSPAVIDSFLDVCESLISHPCPSPDSRIDFFASTSAALARWHRRLTTSQLALFRNLCEELGHNLAIADIPATEEQDSGEGFTAALANRKLGIYSLQEGSARRAALLLRQLVPNLRVEVFSDHVGGSSALKSAAQQFDFFVIVTAAAKHSATIFIESKRPKDKPTLYANGQGSSSIFQSLSLYFEGGTA